jgi:hypothetical protein
VLLPERGPRLPGPVGGKSKALKGSCLLAHARFPVCPKVRKRHGHTDAVFAASVFVIGLLKISFLEDKYL